MPADLPTAAAGHELHPSPLPPVPIAQNPDIPKGRLSRIVNRLPKGQFLRYLGVGIWNTFFGYLSFAAFALPLLTPPSAALSLPRRGHRLARLHPHSTSRSPISVTNSFVFRTKGNYLIEWLRCFAVYGFGMLPGLLILSALTKLLQTVLHNHRAPLVRGPGPRPATRRAITTTSSLFLHTRLKLQSRRRLHRRRPSPWASPPSPASSATADSPSNPPSPSRSAGPGRSLKSLSRSFPNLEDHLHRHSLLQRAGQRPQPLHAGSRRHGPHRQVPVRAHLHR